MASCAPRSVGTGGAGADSRKVAALVLGCTMREVFLAPHAQPLGTASGADQPIRQRICRDTDPTGGRLSK